MSTIDYVVVIAYLALMIVIGFIVTSKIRQFKDYFLAGGQLTTPLLVCTLVSTYYDLDVTLGTSERGFYDGLSAWFWFSRPYYVAILIAAFVITKRLKKFQFMTLPDVLDHSYGKWARVSGAIACFIYSLPITAIAGINVLFAVIGIPQQTALIVSIGVCVCYTALGGLWADVITDTIQFVLMCVTISLVIPGALNLVGGFDFVKHLPESHMSTTGNLNPWLIAAWCTSTLTVFVEPSFYQRIFAAKDSKAVSKALIIGIFLWAAYDWCVTLIGMIARAAVESNLIPQTEGKESLIVLCLTILPIGLKGLFIVGLLAAAMSSIDTYSLLASGNLVYDIYKPLFNPNIKEKTLLILAKVGTVAVTIVGLLMTFLFDRISDAWIFTAGVLTSVVFVPVIMAIYTHPKRISGIISSVSGLAALLIFYYFIYRYGSYNAEQESYVYLIGGMEIWREFAVLFALPISFLGFLTGQLFGKTSDVKS